MPQLLRDILEPAVLRQRGFVLLRETRGVFEVLTEGRQTPDLVILGLTGAEDATLVPALFTRWPHAQIMTISEAGDDAAIYELRPRQRALGQMSPTEMIRVLHEAVHGSRESS